MMPRCNLPHAAFEIIVTSGGYILLEYLIQYLCLCIMYHRYHQKRCIAFNHHYNLSIIIPIEHEHCPACLHILRD